MGLSHNSENLDESYTVLFGIRVWSHTPLEIQIPSLRVALTIEMTNEEKHRLRLQKLEALDDKCLQAQQQFELYQARIFRAFDNKVKKRTFKKDDLVLAIRRHMVMTYKTKEKFQHKCEGLFVIESVYLNRAYRLITPDGDTLIMPINGRFLKKYYPWQGSSPNQVNITPLIKTSKTQDI